MKIRRLIYGATVSLLLSAASVPALASDTSPAVASAYKNNNKTFNLWFQQSVNVVKGANLAVKCGLVPASARSAELAAMTSFLLEQADRAYGDGKGNISFHGTAEFYQAIKALYHLDTTMSLSKKGPDQKTCSLLAQSGISSELKKMIASGL